MPIIVILIVQISNHIFKNVYIIRNRIIRLRPDATAFPADGGRHRFYRHAL